LSAVQNKHESSDQGTKGNSGQKQTASGGPKTKRTPPKTTNMSPYESWSEGWHNTSLMSLSSPSGTRPSTSRSYETDVDVITQLKAEVNALKTDN
jgi:hypothetical protein